MVLKMIKEIVSGWWYYFNENDSVEEVARKRMEICNGCQWHSSKMLTKRPDVHCTKCGCTLAAKTRSLESSCPLKKWTSTKK